MKAEVYLPRLAFIRHLYDVGVEQSKQPIPVGAKSLLTFHDAVELFLVLASIHLNTTASAKTSFMEYFGHINDALKSRGLTLSGKVSMGNLNDARVYFKHHDGYPAIQDLPKYRSGVYDFFIDNTPIVFDNVNFEDISLSSLVQYNDARVLFVEAEPLMKIGSYNEALEKIALGFSKILAYINGRSFSESELSLFSRVELRHFRSMPYRTKDNRLDEFIRLTTSSMRKVQDALKLLALGVDLQKYNKFIALTPIVSSFLDGHTEVIARKDVIATFDSCKFAFDFAIESAIRMQEYIDFSQPFEP